MEKRELKFLALLACAIIILILFAVFYVSHLEQLKQKVIGTELEVYSFSHGEMVEIIDSEDITAIQFVTCPNLDKGCYRVSIGRDPTMWYIYYDPV